MWQKCLQNISFRKIFLNIQNGPNQNFKQVEIDFIQDEMQGLYWITIMSTYDFKYFEC